MALLPNGVRFINPTDKLRIDCFGRNKAKVMDMVSSGNRVNSDETWMLRPFRQYEVATQPGFLDHDSHERHAKVESDSCLLGENRNRTASSNCRPQRLEQAFHGGWFSTEVRFEVPARAAKMRLVAIGNRAATLRTSPKALSRNIRRGSRTFQESCSNFVTPFQRRQGRSSAHDQAIEFRAHTEGRGYCKPRPLLDRSSGNIRPLRSRQ